MSNSTRHIPSASSFPPKNPIAFCRLLLVEKKELIVEGYLILPLTSPVRDRLAQIFDIDSVSIVDQYQQ